MIARLIVFFIIIPSAFSASLSKQELARRLSQFDYDRRDHAYTLQEVRSTKKHCQFEGLLETNDPITALVDNISFGLYRAKKAGPKPLILIMPSIEGEIILERDVARYFANRGYVAIIARLNQNIADPNRPLADIDEFLIRSTVSIRKLIDYAITNENIDSEKISAFGVSLGGIRTALTTGVDLRIKKAVVIVGGGNIPQILTSSQQSIVANYRYVRMGIEGLSRKLNFKKYLKEHILLDPTVFAHRRSKNDIFMIIGKYDRFVPTDTQYQLWESFNRPKRKVVSAGHVLTAVRYRLYLEHFKKFIEEENYSISGDFASTFP